MNLTLIVSDNCEACERAINTLRRLQSANPKILAEIVHVKSYKEKNIFVTPALLVNSELFSYGDIDEHKLLSKIN